MKNKLIILPLMVFVLVGGTIYGQGRGNKNPKAQLERLEKIRLMEVLEMSEEVSVRFFARHKELKEKQKAITEHVDSLINTMKENLEKEKGNKEKSQQLTKKFIEDIQKAQEQIIRIRQNYITSLSDILTSEQIAKLLIFEIEFRQEMQNLLFKNRNRKMMNRGD